MDIHGYEGRLHSVLKTIKESSTLSKRNKDAILRFHLNCFSEGLSVPRVAKYMYTLSRLAQWLGKDFELANKDDIKALAGKLERRSDWSDWTKRDYRITLKKFYRWLRNTEDYPEEVKWLRSNLRNRNQKLPEDLLTEDEVKRLIEATDHARDRALISVLYESGCRIGELASLRFRDINFDEHGAQLLVNGKTGSRMIRIIASVPYLTEWINKHPKKNDPQESLWVRRDNRCGALTYGGIKRVLELAKEKSGIKKKVNPHNFRHSRATYLAKHLTEAQMKQYLGWTQSSDMAAIYVHLSGRDVDDSILKLNGVAKGEAERQESKLKPKQCQHCGQINPATGKFCNRCGMVLDLEIAMQLDESRKVPDDMMARLAKDPEVMNLLLKKIVDLGMEEKLREITAI